MNIAIGDGVENVWQLQDLSDQKSNQRIATSSGRMRMKIKPKTDKNAKICQKRHIFSARAHRHAVRGRRAHKANKTMSTWNNGESHGSRKRFVAKDKKYG